MKLNNDVDALGFHSLIRQLTVNGVFVKDIKSIIDVNQVKFNQKENVISENDRLQAHFGAQLIYDGDLIQIRLV